jgi:hypothetical protein
VSQVEIELADDVLRLVRRAYERYFVDGLPEVDQPAEFRRCLDRARAQEERLKERQARRVAKELGL